MGNKFDPPSLLMVGQVGQVKTFKFRYTGTGHPVMNGKNIKHEVSCGCIAKVKYENGHVVADMTVTPKKSKVGQPHRVRRSITVFFQEGTGVNEYILILMVDII